MTTTNVPRWRWLILLSVFLGPTAYFIAVYAIPPLLPTVMYNFGLTYAIAGSLISLVNVTRMILALPFGVWSDKYGARLLGIIGLLLTSIGAYITAIGLTFPIMLVGRVILGIGGALVLTAAPSLVSKWFSKKEEGFVMGVYALNVPVASLVAFNLLSPLQSISWQSPLYLAAIICFISLIIYSLTIHNRPHTFEVDDEVKPTPNLFSIPALRDHKIWVLAVTWGIFGIATGGFFTWAKTFLVVFKGMSSNEADFVTSLYMLPALISPFTGLLVGRVSTPKHLIMFSSLFLTLGFLFVPFSNIDVVPWLFVFIGFCATVLVTTVLYLPSKILLPENVGVGFGILVVFASIGQAVGPILIGFVADTWASELIIYLTITGVSSLIVLLSFKFSLMK